MKLYIPKVEESFWLRKDWSVEVPAVTENIRLFGAFNDATPLAASFYNPHTTKNFIIPRKVELAFAIIDLRYAGRDSRVKIRVMNGIDGAIHYKLPFGRGKVQAVFEVPLSETDKIDFETVPPISLRDELTQPLTDVHTEHCCIKHGCKYGDEDCTITTKKLIQSFECEHCSWDIED